MEITTWVLVSFLTMAGRGGPLVIDNIASLAACENLKARIEAQMEEAGKGEGFLRERPKVRQTNKCHPVTKTIGQS